MYQLKQSSTARPLLFMMVDSSDHVSGKTGLSPTVTISKNGGSFASPSGAVTEIANGWYKVAGNATDTGTLGPLLLHATGAGADPTDAEYDVVAYDPHSATNLGLSNLDAAISGIPSANANADALLDRANAVETSLSPRGALRLILAALAGKLSGAATTTVTIRNVGDSKNRITATVDADGNRSAVTTDAT